MTDSGATTSSSHPIALGALVGRLERFPAALTALAAVASDGDARWKPAPVAWSIHEIVCHLADEEERDFRIRIEMLLDDPALEWPKIDPVGWVSEHNYAATDLRATLVHFTEERRHSVAWLRTLDAPDWSRSRRHPAGFMLAAGDLMASWAAHDALHLRQIGRRLYELAVRDSGGHRVEYAGEFR